MPHLLVYRICPGMYLADRLAFHVMVMTNSLFHIVPLEGRKVPDPSSIQWTDTVIQYVSPFPSRS
jgi:hypothetical protein